MSDSLHETQSLELRDAAGRVLGSFVAGRALAEVAAERDRLRADVERLKAELQEARQALETARREAARIEAERIESRKAIAELLKEPPTFTEEERADLERNGRPLEGLIEELEREQPS